MFFSHTYPGESLGRVSPVLVDAENNSVRERGVMYFIIAKSGKRERSGKEDQMLVNIRAEKVKKGAG